MNVKNITLKNLPELSAIHIAAFPTSALTQLGKESVSRYYEWQLTGPHDCLAIGAFDEHGRMLGFCFGGVFRGALSGFVQKNRNFLVLQVLRRPWLIFTNSIFRDRLRVGLRVAKKRSAQPAVSSDRGMDRPFGILSIAIDPVAQGKGVGQLLMQYSEIYARQNGFTSMGLTVAVDNIQAIRFYEKSGWVKKSDGATWTGAMVKALC